MTVSQDGSEFAVWYYKDFCQPEEAYINVRLTGLEQTARYQDEDGSCYTGEMLMNLGLPLRWKNGDYFYRCGTLSGCRKKLCRGGKKSRPKGRDF